MCTSTTEETVYQILVSDFFIILTKLSVILHLAVLKSDNLYNGFTARVSSEVKT